MNTDSLPMVVVGASAGGIAALLQLARGLPAGFPACVCIVQHIGANPSTLPELLRRAGPNPAMHAHDGQALRPGTLLVAPPDHHMLLEPDGVRISHGARENHARPAIDPLFRTAAVAFGARAIGVILTGMLDDGAAGLRAIKQCGGRAVVQDPYDAHEPEMPLSALAATDVDHVVPLDELAGLLVRLVAAMGLAQGVAARPSMTVPATVAREVLINRGENSVAHLQDIGTPSGLTCPDCGGGLWELKDEAPPRYRCHTGHAFSPVSLARAQSDTIEESLWTTVRALQEKIMLLSRIAEIADAGGDRAQAEAGRAQIERLRAQAQRLLGMAQSGLEAPSP